MSFLHTFAFSTCDHLSNTTILISVLLCCKRAAQALREAEEAALVPKLEPVLEVEPDHQHQAEPEPEPPVVVEKEEEPSVIESVEVAPEVVESAPKEPIEGSGLFNNIAKRVSLLSNLSNSIFVYRLFMLLFACLITHLHA